MATQDNLFISSLTDRTTGKSFTIVEAYDVIISGGASDPSFTTLTEGQVPKANASQKLIYGGATVDPTTEEWTFDKSINVPGGSVKVGEVLQLSEGIADLVVVDLLKENMSFSVNADFDKTVGSSDPFYYDFGAGFLVPIQSDDSTVIIANPLTFSATGTVTSPSVRLIDEVVFRSNGPMTNFRAKLVDNTTGLAIRYIPSKAAYEGIIDGLSIGTGEITFYFSEEGTDTSTDIYQGYSPFLIESGQQIDFTVIADSIDLLGDASDYPYLVVEAHDGPPVIIGQADHATRNQSTGLLEGGVISQASATTVDWTSGVGQVADYTDPENPVITEVTWDAVAGVTPANLATDGTTVFGYDANGTIVEKLITAASISDAHDVIWFGSASHLSSTIVSVITAPGNLGYDGIGSFEDFINLIIGPANVDGNIYGANGTNMNIDVVGGNAFMLGSNFRNDTTLSDIITLPNEVPVTFLKVYRSADPGLSVVYDGAATTTIDPTQYDDGSGTLQSVTAGYWTIQRIFRSRTGLTTVAYGQEEFADKATALAALGSEAFEEKSPLPFNLFRCSLVVDEGATDLSDTAEAEFFVQSSFRLVGATSASSTIPGITNPGGADTNVQYNDGGVFGGDSSFTFNDSTKEVTIDGKLTVTGLIDPTGLVLTEQASVPDTPAAGFGYVWTKNTTPSTLIFTDDAGTDHLIEAGGGDVEGPASSITNAIAIFDDTTGKSIDDFPQITTTTSSDDRFLNIDMAVAFDGEVGLRIRNELGVDQTTLTYEGNNEETYFNTYGSGGLITTIAAGDCVYQMSGAAANFKVNATTSPDTSDVFTVVAGGTNGGSANFLVGSRNPEGNLNKAFGHFYLRTDGVNTGLYAKKSVGVSTTDWYPYPTAPQTTNINGVALWDNTTGTGLKNSTSFLAVEGINDISVIIKPVTSSGFAILEFLDNSATTRGSIEFDEDADTFSINSPSVNAGFSINNLAAAVDTEITTGATASTVIKSSGANINAPLEITATGTNGGTSQFFTSTVTPEGAITADGGALCIQDSGATSDIFLKRTDGGNTGWVDLLHSGSGVQGPVSSVVNAMSTWGDTSGSSLLSVDTALISSDANDTTLTIDAVSASGDSVIELRDNTNNAHLTIMYDGVTDIPVISSSLGVLRFQSSPAWPFSNYVDVVSPGSTAITGYRIANTSLAAKFLIEYNEGTDACTIDLNSDLLLTTTSSESALTILSPSVTGDAKIALENNAGSETFAIRYLQNSDVVQVQTNKNTTFSNSIASGTFTFSHGVSGQTILETTGANTNAPISLKTTGANGATSNIFVSDETPQGNITAVNVGDLCVRADGVDGDDSLLYIAADSTNSDWYYHPKIFEGADRTLTVPSGSGSGSASVILANSSGAAKGTFAFDQTLDEVTMEVDAVSLDISSTGLLSIESGTDVLRLRRDEASTAGPAIQFENDTINSRMFLLDANPQEVTVASPADFAILEDSTDSGMFLHEGFQGSDDDWHKVVTSPSDGMLGTVYGGLGQYQNYLEYSEDIDNAAWTKEVAVTVTPNNIVSPNGQTTTDTVAWSSSSLGISQVVSLAAATTYTLTFWGSNVSGNPILTFDLGSTNKNITLDSTLRKYTLRLVTGAGPTHTLSVSKPISAGSFGLFGFNLSLGTDELPYVHTLDTAISTLSYGGIINGPLRVENIVSPLQLDDLKINAINYNPQSILTGNAGDICIVGDLSEPDDSRIYIHGDGTDTDDDWWFMPTVYAGTSEHLELNSNTPSASASISLKSFTASQQVTLQYDDSTGNGLLEMAAPNGAEINSPLSFLLIHADDDEIRLRRGDTGVTGEIVNIQNITTGFGIWADTQTPIGNSTGSPGDIHVEVNGVDSAISIHKGASSDNTSWKEVLTKDERTLVYSVDVDGIDQTEFVLIGEYRVVDTGETGDYATDYACNNQHTSIEVNSLTGSGVVTFTGVSMSESSGIPTATTETITVDATGKYQTDKKWLEITNIDIPVGITAINYDVEVLGYLDMQNSDFTVTGMRIDGLSNGNDADFSLGIIKIQDDGSKKCQLVDIEAYGYDAKDDLIVDDLRTGGDDRSYIATTSIWTNGTNACLKVNDYSTYFTSDENVIEGASKAEGIIIHFTGTDGGSLKNISTLNLHLTIEMN
ncbi:MAG: hypothetical protein GY804_00240 [Alphaproteobacteria bacterium]|nr:hypothetical protein [Alphaproteobacteria bacterium]